MRIAIIGAGIAGLSCAEALERLGHGVSLYDKGRGAGGRMATRRTPTDAGEAAFDHGAQYFTARDPRFATEVEKWATRGIAARWPAAGAAAWVGTPAMNAPLKYLAAGRAVAWGRRVDALAREDGGWRLTGEGLNAVSDAVSGSGPDSGPFDAVIVAVPAEQAAPLLASHAAGAAALAAATPSTPCWTAMAAFPVRLPIGDTVRNAGPIGWAARNSAKPGRSGPESWVIQADPAWSAAHLEEDAAVVARTLAAALAAMLPAPLPSPLSLTAHRWRYARCGSAGRDALWDAAAGIGVCGDWLIAPRVESAWLSGRRLADMIGMAR